MNPEKELTSPEFPLEETVAFAYSVFTQLKKEVFQDKLQPHNAVLDFCCFPMGTLKSVLELNKEHRQNLVQPAFTAPHPVIVQATRLIVDKVMSENGFSTISEEQKKFRWKNRPRNDFYDDNEYTVAGALYTDSIGALSISCRTSPEKLRAVFDIDAQGIRPFALRALKKVLNKREIQTNTDGTPGEVIEIYRSEAQDIPRAASAGR